MSQQDFATLINMANKTEMISRKATKIISAGPWRIRQSPYRWPQATFYLGQRLIGCSTYRLAEM